MKFFQTSTTPGTSSPVAVLTRTPLTIMPSFSGYPLGGSTAAQSAVRCKRRSAGTDVLQCRVRARRIKVILTDLEHERVWTARRELFANPNRCARHRLRELSLDQACEALQLPQ